MKCVIPMLLLICLGCAPSPNEKPSGSPPPPEMTHHSHELHQVGGMAGQLMVSTDPAVVQAGQPTQLNLMIHDDNGAMIRDFEVFHERKVHLMVVSAGLDQFAHIHPDLDAAGNLTISHVFPTGGKYRLYADYQPAGKPQAIALAEIQVTGDTPPVPALVPNVPGLIQGPGLQADITLTPAKPGEGTPITFRLLDAMNQPVTNLQPYLGAMGHLVILSADGKHYVHAHPVEGLSSPGEVQFAAHFPHAGLYKGWGQFQRADTVETVPFVVQVDESGGIAQPRMETHGR